MTGIRDRLYRASAEDRSHVVRTLTDVLSRDPHIAFAYLHGSFLDGPFHDIDVAVYVNPSSVGEEHISGLSLSQRVAEDLPYPLDVRIVNDAPVSFLFHVLRGQPLFIRDDDLLTDLMEDIARRYHDMAPLLRQGARDAFAG